MQACYAEINMMIKTKEDLNKCWEIRNINRPIFPNLIYRFKAIPIKIPASSFKESNKMILK